MKLAIQRVSASGMISASSAKTSATASAMGVPGTTRFASFPKQTAIRGGVESLLQPGIDHPDGGYAHALVVVDPLDHVSHAVFAGENLDAEDGWLGNDESVRRTE